MTTRKEARAARKYGAYAGFTTEASPSRVAYHGENPSDEVARLLDLHLSGRSRFVDIGCGAGGTLCRVAAKVAEACGVDQAADLLAVARERVEQASLENVRLLELNVADEQAVLPDGPFDVALSERGPNMNERLVRKLTDHAVFVQELVGGMDGYPLKEVFGRRAYSPYHFGGAEALLARYADLGLFPISVKQYFYERFFRDAEHLAAFLSEGFMLSNWRLEPCPFDAERDGTALELYVRYNTTADGVRVLGHRWVFALRRATIAYYPVDGPPPQ